MMKLIIAISLVAMTFGFPCLDAAEKKGAAAEPELKIHPKVFTFIQGWLSDGESPIATEINLDAVADSRNQFGADEVKQENGVTRSPGREGRGFLQYRVLEHKGNRYKVEFLENGGGSLTTAATIEFAIEKRTMEVNGKATTIRVLRVLSYADKL